MSAIASGTQVQACVSNDSPSQRSNVTVYGRLVVDGNSISNTTMTTSWHYKTSNPSCEGVSGGDGLASCTRNISTATKGYEVRIDVYFNYGGRSYSGSTSFTPR